MPKKCTKLLNKPVRFWIATHVIGYIILISSPATYLAVNQVAFDKKQKENPGAALENGMAAQKTAKNAMQAQALVGATLLFGGLAMWRKKEKQYE